MRGRWRGMKARSRQPHTLTPAQRGQIVQRVIVDGWSTAAAAHAADMPERLVAAWVVDFRRHGMASLHRKPGKTVAARLRILHSSRRVVLTIAFGLRWLFLSDRPLPPSAARRSQDDRRGGS
jgi:transposase-like protein